MTNVRKTIYYSKLNNIFSHLNTNIQIFIDMKTLLSILMFFSFGLSLSAQQSQLYNIHLDSSTNGRFTSMCDSVIGSVGQSSTPIPSYGYLESNGYCYYLSHPQIAFTFCFEFIAKSGGVYLNSGFTVIGCTNVNFTQLTLCDITSDIVVGEGQFFNNLTAGHHYVWCVTGNATGFFCQGLATICPYWSIASVLPVNLTLFTATPTSEGVMLRWTTMSESNSDYFSVETSKDLITYRQVAKVKSKGNTNYRVDYEYLDRIPYDGVSYYRLNQYDFNGYHKVYDPIFTDIELKKPFKILNVLGNEVNMDYNGMKILIFEDGSAVKHF